MLVQNQKSKSRMRDIKTSLISLSPIAGLNYIHQRKEQKHKNNAMEIIKNNNLIESRKNSPLKRIECCRILKDMNSSKLQMIWTKASPMVGSSPMIIN